MRTLWLGASRRLGGRRALAVLAHRWAGAAPTAEQPARNLLLVLHGILGSKANWNSPARQLLKAAEGLGGGTWHALCLDHRGHADSPSGHPPHTIESCAADVEETLAHLRATGGPATAQLPGGGGRADEALATEMQPDGGGERALPLVVVGHSFGGKVALALAQRRLSCGLPPAAMTWLIDSNPGHSVSSAYAAAHARAMAEGSRGGPAGDGEGEGGSSGASQCAQVAAELEAEDAEAEEEACAQTAAEAAEAAAGRTEQSPAFVLSVLERAVEAAQAGATPAGTEPRAVWPSRAAFELALTSPQPAGHGKLPYGGAAGGGGGGSGERQGVSPPIAQWLAQATRPLSEANRAGPVVLSHDVGVLRCLLRAYRRTDYWALLEAGGTGDVRGRGLAEGQQAALLPRVGVIVGGRNRGGWGEPALLRLHAAAESSANAAAREGRGREGARVRVAVLESAGHNVHVDDLPGLVALVAPSLAARAGSRPHG